LTKEGTGVDLLTHSKFIVWGAGSSEFSAYSKYKVNAYMGYIKNSSPISSQNLSILSQNILYIKKPQRG
jgi:hypothetical protein